MKKELYNKLLITFILLISCIFSSNVLNAQCETTPPQGLQVLNVTATTVKLKWIPVTTNSLVNGYVIRVYNPQQPTAPIGTYYALGTNTSTKIVNNLTPGTCYMFTISAKCSTGYQSPESPPVYACTIIIEDIVVELTSNCATAICALTGTLLNPTSAGVYKWYSDFRTPSTDIECYRIIMIDTTKTPPDTLVDIRLLKYNNKLCSIKVNGCSKIKNPPTTIVETGGRYVLENTSVPYKLTFDQSTGFKVENLPAGCKVRFFRKKNCCTSMPCLTAAPTTNSLIVNNQHTDKEGVKLLIYPNPSLQNNDVKILYELPTDSPVTLQISDLNGNIIQNILNNDFQSKGSYQQLAKEDLPSGIYIITLKVENTIITQKLIKM